jgi:hypothetical protein
MAQACSTCRGAGLLHLGGGTATKCPMCEGSGKQFDPGRKFSYLMGPITLNGSGAASAANSLTAQLKGVATQVVNWPFRWMFSLAQSSFPFLVQIQDAGAGGNRPFSNQQVLSTLVFGDGTHPYPLPTPFTFPMNQNIVADFTDLYGGVGTAGVTTGSAIVTYDTGGLFNTAPAPGPPFANVPLWQGATITLAGVSYAILSVQSQNQLTLAMNYAGATVAHAAYSVPNNISIVFDGVELSQ